MYQTSQANTVNPRRWSLRYRLSTNMNYPPSRSPNGSANPKRLSLICRVLGLILIITAGPARSLDVDAGDYGALPKGTNLALVYFQHAQRDAIYSGGTPAPLEAGLDSSVSIVRAVHYTDIANHRVNFQFLLPFGRLEAKEDIRDMGTANGFGDLILASSVWLQNSPTTGQYFAITPYLFLPTGNYDSDDALNLGENRWKFVLQAGYITPVTDSLTLDLVADATLFGDNEDFGLADVTLAQKPLYQFQSFLRYHVNDQLDLRAGLSYAFGGETEINNIDQDDRLRTTKANIGAAWFLTSTAQLIVNYGRDIDVENGFREDNRLNLRILKLF